MTDRELMQQALEALTRIWEDGLENYPVWAHEAAIDNLRDRLAQPEQEPLQFKCTIVDDAHPNGVPLSRWGKQPEQEPHGWRLVPIEPTQEMLRATEVGPVNLPLFCWKAMLSASPQPPQRKPLTDEQLEKLMMDYGYDADDEFMKEMLKEAADGIKEKNA